MWTVPQPVLRLVALALLGVAGFAFAMGVIGAEPRGGRLPGEAPGSGETVAPVVATDAQALDENNQSLARRDEPLDEAAEDEAPAATAKETVETASVDPQIPALQVPDEPPAQAPAPKAPAPKAPAPKAPPAPTPSGDAIGDLVDGLTPSELPPF